MRTFKILNKSSKNWNLSTNKTEKQTLPLRPINGSEVIVSPKINDKIRKKEQINNKETTGENSIYDVLKESQFSKLGKL